MCKFIKKYKKGVSFIELIVTILISTIILTAVYNAFLKQRKALIYEKGGIL